MAVRTISWGGTDWINGEVLYAADLNDTIGLIKCAGNQVKYLGALITTTSSSFVNIPSATITFTTEARRVLLSFTATTKNTGANFNYFDFAVDGTRIASGTLGGITWVPAVAGQSHSISMTAMTDVLSAGSHTFTVQWRTSGGTAVIEQYSAPPETSFYIFDAMEVVI